MEGMCAGPVAESETDAEKQGLQWNNHRGGSGAQSG